MTAEIGTVGDAEGEVGVGALGVEGDLGILAVGTELVGVETSVVLVCCLA